ncbi:hypothetical protein PQO03_12510 [Lentisphaera profundi]|uniref:Uncharacterized protein n=1 Tax=Lentisphaera profundi TaxID=1658616 RepID=A0ABY7VXY6_9BACT|nr:hypothetical protein [Lentisphaera profundi]WDE98659.1 hypothetical protein PQO03_12510 [Lentisphaera profundi]
MNNFVYDDADDQSILKLNNKLKSHCVKVEFKKSLKLGSLNDLFCRPIKFKFLRDNTFRLEFLNNFTSNPQLVMDGGKTLFNGEIIQSMKSLKEKTLRWSALNPPTYDVYVTKNTTIGDLKKLLRSIDNNEASLLMSNIPLPSPQVIINTSRHLTVNENLSDYKHYNSIFNAEHHGYSAYKLTKPKSLKGDDLNKYISLYESPLYFNYINKATREISASMYQDRLKK